MADSNLPKVYSIAAHRGFADALVAGLAPRYSDEELGLANLTLLLPSRRAIRTVTEAFIRNSGTGLLMPRMAVVGDLDLDETLGSMLDPLGAADIPPAVEPSRRWLRLAQLVKAERPELTGAASYRLAREIARTMDRLLVEDVAPQELLGEAVLDLLGDLSSHWKRSIHLFATVQLRWLAELEERGEIDASARRNRLFDHVAQEWKLSPPAVPVVAAGVTSAAPALARLLRVVSELSDGAVILPDLDLGMGAEVWEELGRAGHAPEPDAPPFGPSDALTHPQYHLKLLLNRMGISRDEVQPWHRRGLAAAPPERAHAISSVFLPPEASKQWVELDSSKRRMAGVRIIESANPEEEAQAIALLVRQALIEPEKRVAVVTPDRDLAGRVVGHLQRWNIEADDSAGRTLSQTAAGRVVLLLAEVMVTRAAPVSLMALLQHPFVGSGDDRAAWLEQARTFELKLRGPRPESGIAPLEAIVADLAGRLPAITTWWETARPVIASLCDAADSETVELAGILDLLAKSGECLAGDALWSREDGRALSAFVEDVRHHARDTDAVISIDDAHTILKDAMDLVSVRPPYGGHPRVSILGLLEARMSRADLVICAGLNEGSWPQPPAPDAFLPPAILRALGVPGADFRIGLSAHDLAGLLGAPEVILSRSSRDAGGPALPSRFLLRVKALLGKDLIEDFTDAKPVEWARAIDAVAPASPYPQPMPSPSSEQRDVPVSVTALDRLLGDPYQFYAQAILGLRKLDLLDAEPSPAWQGTAAHEVLERWHKEGGALEPIAEEVLQSLNAHPLMVGLWRPRLMAALQAFEKMIAEDRSRKVAAVEQKGEMLVDGVRIHGRADRIDRLADGSLAIVDYKTGKPPSHAMVSKGYALQLGLLGLMAEGGGIDGVSGDASTFEYWSLGRNEKSETGFGYVETPLKIGSKRTGIAPDEFLPLVTDYLHSAIARFIKGDEPFAAKPNPDYPGYSDYDQLMRLEEWQTRGNSAEGEA